MSVAKNSNRKNTITPLVSAFSEGRSSNAHDLSLGIVTDTV